MKYEVTINKETMNVTIYDKINDIVYDDNLKLEPYNRPDGLHLQINYKKSVLFEEVEGKGIVQVPTENGKFKTTFETDLSKSGKTSNMLSSNLFAW